MSKLEDLQKELYREKEPNQEPSASYIIDLKKSPSRNNTSSWQSSPPKKHLTKKQKIYLFSGLGLVFVLMIFAVLSWIWGQRAFNENKVQIKMTGPDKIIAGQNNEYYIQYGNKSKVVLKNVKLFIYWPEGTQKDSLIEEINLDDIEPNQETKVKSEAVILGQKDAEKEIKTKLSFEPANINLSFEQESLFKTMIVATPLILTLNMPEKIVDGQKLYLTLSYLNESETPFADLILKLGYPSGFEFESSEPLPQRGSNIWEIEKLEEKKEGKIVIIGKIAALGEEAKLFKAQIGQEINNELVLFSQTSKNAVISSALLTIEQTVNEKNVYVAQNNETLNFQIDYKNTATAAIKDVVITSNLQDYFSILDLSTLKADNGSAVNNIITWNSSQVKDLALLSPGQEGKLSFSIKIKSQLPVAKSSDKNFSFDHILKIESLSPPLNLLGTQIGEENKLTVKIATQLQFSAKVYFKEGPFSNSGSLPPKAGEKTTYTVVWQILNSSNDIEDVEVQSVLPPQIQWTDKISLPEENISYNKNESKVLWKIKKIEAGTGILRPVKQIAFQIALTPHESQIGKEVLLIGESTIKAKEPFTGLSLSAKKDALYTNFLSDASFDYSEGKVVR